MKKIFPECLILPLLTSLFIIAADSAADIHYVNLYNPAPALPYTTWVTAATNIQTAIDAAGAGDDVVVSNGVYQVGGNGISPGWSNRVAVTKPIMVRSLNGPQVTIIRGNGLMGPRSLRCVYLTNGAVLAGFTLTNGATDLFSQGGGVYCESDSAVVTNCVLTSNSAHSGGGSCNGTLNNCTLVGNSATNGGGSYGGTLNNCTLLTNSASVSGGGSFDGTLNNCTLTGNSASFNGGGAAWGTLNSCTLIGNAKAMNGGGGCYGTLNNCTLTGNWAYLNGGGAYQATLNNCTLMGNSAGYDGGGSYQGTLKNCTLAGNWASQKGGGCFDGTLKNCIIYYNRATDQYSQNFQSILNYCCTTPLPNGSGNFSNAPLFINTNGWSNLRLQSNSPCINGGDNTSAPGAMDLDGNSRISGGVVDVGAYEFQFHPGLQVSNIHPRLCAITITGLSNVTYSIEMTTDLLSNILWTTALQLKLTNSRETFTWTNQTEPQRFFRAVEK